LANAGALRVLIDRILPLRDAAAAHRLVETNEPLGKVILDPTLQPQ
jgi:NADPH:quinone reductase-like Zn-dependent oxidoreductase